MHTLTRATICAAFALTGLQAHALYRCGSVYQDRPCDSGVDQKQLMRSGAVIVTPAAPPVKPAAAAPAPAASAVKAAPVTPAAPAAASASAVAKSAAPVPAAPVAPVAAPAAAAPVAAAKPSAAAPSAPAVPDRALAAVNNKARCASLGTQLDNVQAKARSGGTAVDMERYAQERRAVQKSLVDAGC